MRHIKRCAAMVRPQLRFFSGKTIEVAGEKRNGWNFIRIGGRFYASTAAEEGAVTISDSFHYTGSYHISYIFFDSYCHIVLLFSYCVGFFQHKVCWLTEFCEFLQGSVT